MIDTNQQTMYCGSFGVTFAKAGKVYLQGICLGRVLPALLGKMNLRIGTDWAHYAGQSYYQIVNGQIAYLDQVQVYSAMLVSWLHVKHIEVAMKRCAPSH